ncbi:MAG: glycosyltransferase family 4 protein [Thermoplasmata archaeon]
MRILRLDTWDGRGGGAQEYIRTVCSELEARGHPNRVINLVDRPGDRPLARETTVLVPSMGLRRVSKDILDAPEVREAFDGLVRSFDPDLVQLHHFDAGFATVADLFARVRAPVVMTAHDAELVCPISTLVRPGNIICEGGVRPRCLFTGCHVGLGGPYNLWQRRVFDRKVRPRVRAYLCPSMSLTRYLDAHGYRPAVHLPSFAHIPSEVIERPTPPPSASTPPTIGYLGRLEWYKGVHDLIDALALVRRAVPDVRLDLAGDGPFRPTLEAQVARLGLSDHVVWRGQVDGPAKEAWFRGIHVAATPSNLWENFPLTALEALTRSRPVVATDIGGIPDIVDDGVSGRLVPIASPHALADALRSLLLAPEAAARLGAEGRRRTLARYTPAIHIDRLLAVYRAVLGGSTLRSGMEAQDLVDPRATA